MTRGKSKAGRLPLMPTWLGIQQKQFFLLSKFKKTLSYQGMFGGLIHQGGNTKYECLRNQCWKAKGMDVIQPSSKQLHIFVIKHCIIFRQ